jgi:hypothetical protein
MLDMSDCQIPCLVKIKEGTINFENQPIKQQVKRLLAKPWNYHIKRFLRRIRKAQSGSYVSNKKGSAISGSGARLTAGDWVRVRSNEEIKATLDNWNELRGCAFLANMWQYCGTTQQVMISMKRFLDERDYKVKKCNGVILLNGVMCEGTPVFGSCDRRCHYFWREEWLEQICPPDGSKTSNLTLGA